MRNGPACFSPQVLSRSYAMGHGALRYRKNRSDPVGIPGIEQHPLGQLAHDGLGFEVHEKRLCSPSISLGLARSCFMPTMIRRR